MTVLEYSKLKDDIVLAVNSLNMHSEVLYSLKELFRDDINSERRLEQIITVGHLLDVLELRDVLSEDNVEPLIKIAQKLANSDSIIKQLKEFQETHLSKELDNYYVSKSQCDIETNKENNAEGYLNTNPVSSKMSKRKKQRIFETITEEIGSYWRDLGRNLMIREYEIDEINNENIKLSIKAKKLLERFEYKADPQRWFFILCDALEKTRRKDLARSIQEIMGMNI